MYEENMTELYKLFKRVKNLHFIFFDDNTNEEKKKRITEKLSEEINLFLSLKELVLEPTIGQGVMINSYENKLKEWSREIRKQKLNIN